MSKSCGEKIFNFLQSDEAKQFAKLTKGMSKEQVQDYANRIQSLARGYKLKNIADDEALDMAVERVSEKLKADIASKRRSARIDALKLSEMMDKAKSYDYSAKKIESHYHSGSMHVGDGVRTSIKSQIDAMETKILRSPGALEPTLDKLDGFRLLKSKANQADVIDQIMKGSFRDDDLGKIAKALADHDSVLSRERSKVGFADTELAGRVTKQYRNARLMMNPSELDEHIIKKLGLKNDSFIDSETLAYRYGQARADMTPQEFTKLKNDTAFEIWYNHEMPLIDKTKSLEGLDWSDETAVKQTMRNIFDKITRVRTAENASYNMGSRLQNMERKIFYKDGASFLASADKYGAGDLLNTVKVEARRTAHDIVMVKNFGASPMKNMKALMDKIREENENGDKETEKYLHRMNYQMRYLVGEYSGGSDTWAGALARNIRSYLMMTRLGVTVLRALPDMVNMMQGLKMQLGVNVWQRVHAMMAGIADIAPKKLKSLTHAAVGLNYDARKNFFESLGVATNHFIGSHRFSSDIHDFSGSMAKQASRALKWSGLKHWDQIMKRSTFAAWGNALARRAQFAFEDLDHGTQNTLKSYGIHEGEWEAWRQSVKKLADRNSYMTPDSVYDLTDKQMEASSLSRDDLYHNIMTMFHDSYRFTVPQKSLAMEAWQARFIKNNPAWGQIAPLALQFKSYSIGMVNDVFRRDIDLSRSAAARVWNLGTMVTGLMAAGYASTMAISLAKNESIPTLDIVSNDPKVRAQAEYNIFGSMLSSLGFIGDIVGAFSKGTAEGLLSTLGPGASMLLNTSQFFHSNMERAFKGPQYRAKKSSALLAENFAKNNLSFMNNPITTAVFHYFLAKPLMNAAQQGSYEQEVHHIQKTTGVTPVIN